MRKPAIAIAAAASVFALAAAGAASLTFTSTSFVPEQSILTAQCQGATELSADVDVSDPDGLVNDVTLGSIAAACEGQYVLVELLGTADAVLGTSNAVEVDTVDVSDPTGIQTIDMVAADVPSEDVLGIRVTIADTIS